GAGARRWPGPGSRQRSCQTSFCGLLRGIRSSLPIGSLRLGKQSLDIFEQFAQVFCDDAPHDPVVKAVIAVREDIPERYDVAMFSYRVEEDEIAPADPVQGFPNNLELPLSAAPEQFILLVIVKRLATDKPENSRSRFSDIVEMLEKFIRHKYSRAL